jgi:hypothetical protein
VVGSDDLVTELTERRTAQKMEMELSDDLTNELNRS